MPSWRKDPVTGEWGMIDRPVPLTVKRAPVNQHRWTPGSPRSIWWHRAQIAAAWGIPLAVAVIVALSEDGR